MRRAIVFLEQQSWLGGGQRVLEATIDTVAGDYDCIVAFPDSGSFRSALEQRNLETLDFPIGNYQPGRKSLARDGRFCMAKPLLRATTCGVHSQTTDRARVYQWPAMSAGRCTRRLAHGPYCDFSSPLDPDAKIRAPAGESPLVAGFADPGMFGRRGVVLGGQRSTPSCENTSCVQPAPPAPRSAPEHGTAS